jgi:hypothetical protein
VRLTIDGEHEVYDVFIDVTLDASGTTPTGIATVITEPAQDERR